MRADRIIVLKVDHIGDFVLAGGALGDLRRARPQSHLTLVCNSVVKDLASSLGIFDEIIAFDFYATGVDAPSTKARTDYAAIRACVTGRYDLAIDLRHNPDTRPLLDHIDAGIRAGYHADKLAHPLDLVLPRFSEQPSKLPQRFVPHSETRMRLLVTAVVDTLFPEAERPAPSPRKRPVPIAGDYFVVAPGSSTRIKNWYVDKFARLAGRLSSRLEMPAVVVGSAAETADAGTIAAALPAGASKSLVGQLSLPELRDTLLGSRLFIGNCTGPTHMAARLGVPTVCVFSGVSEPKLWLPRGPHVRVVQAPQPCAPCGLQDETLCKFDRACLWKITVKMVEQACADVLREAAPPRRGWWPLGRRALPSSKPRGKRRNGQASKAAKW